MPLNNDICDDNHSVADLYLLAKVTVPLTKAFKRHLWRQSFSCWSVPVGKGDGAVGHVMVPLELSPAVFRLVEFLHLNFNMLITPMANYQ
jgi:hypothetical protein